MAFIRKCVLFNHWEMNDHYQMAHSITVMRLDPGQTVHRERGKHRECYAIYTGELKVRFISQGQALGYG